MTGARRLVSRVLADPKLRALLVSLGPAAGKVATDLVRQGRWRQLAVVHADTLVDGSLQRVLIDAEPHWVVWSGDEPVAAYPSYDGDLSEALRNVDLHKRRRPDELPTRVTRRRVAERRRARGSLLPGRRGSPEESR